MQSSKLSRGAMERTPEIPGLLARKHQGVGDRGQGGAIRRENGPATSRLSSELRQLIRMCRHVAMEPGWRQYHGLLGIEDDNLARLSGGKESDDLIPGRRALRVVRDLVDPELTQSDFATYVWRFRIASSGNPARLNGFRVSAFDAARVYACLCVLNHEPCPELVFLMDAMLAGPTPVPACRERFDLLHDHLRQPGGKIGTVEIPLERMRASGGREPVVHQLGLFT